MRHRLIPLVLVLALAGCGGGDDDTDSLGQPGPGATTPVPTTTCAPSGTGSTDLTKKPVVPKQTAPAPTETTVVDIVCGTGEEAKSGSRVSVKYVGVLYAGGKEFDASWTRGSDETITFNVGENVIPGFSIGATGMREGGRRMVVIPPKDGYRDTGVPPTIPGNATLIFVMDLVNVG